MKGNGMDMNARFARTGPGVGWPLEFNQMGWAGVAILTLQCGGGITT